MIWNSKKVIFTEDKIIINKRKKLEINYSDIEKCWYLYRSSVPRFYLLPPHATNSIPPGWLRIHLSNSYKSWKKLHLIKLKPEEIAKLPKALKKKIIFNKRTIYD